MSSERSNAVRRGAVVAWFILAAAAPAPMALGQDGGAGEPVTAPSPRERTPRGALLRSVVLPGWGQVYNGQPVKAPILVAAIGGLAYAAVALNADYREYRRAYQYKAFQERVDQGTIEENPRSHYASSYEALADRLGPVRSGALRQRRDALRRNRDLSIMGIGIVWAIGALDAYVNAHLLDFDVGENLTLRVGPATAPGAGPGIGGSLRWRPGT